VKNPILPYILLCSLCCSFNPSVSAQDSVTTYFDVAWKPVKKERASFYRKAVRDGDGWKAKDYFISGNIQMEGAFSDSAQRMRTGAFTYYYENGNKSSEGACVENKRHGAWANWYENGQKEYTGYYENGESEGDWIFWDEEENKNAAGGYKDDKEEGIWERWYANGQLLSRGGYMNGLDTGTWEGWFADGSKDYLISYKNGRLDRTGQWFFPHGQMSAEEIYEEGKLIKSTYWDEAGKRLPDSAKGETMPEYRGGTEAMWKFMADNLKYPEEALRKGIQGRVQVKFVLNEAGNISEPQIVKSVHRSLDEEAIRMVLSMPRWIPGRQFNRPVKVYFTIPVVFAIEN
jgi:TonB family protein